MRPFLLLFFLVLPISASLSAAQDPLPSTGPASKSDSTASTSANRKKTQRQGTPPPVAPRDTSNAPLSSQEKEAQFHYKVALTALQNNDMDIADQELKKAVDLAPNNALVVYNLAIVESKSGKPAEALVNFRKAIDLGLPVEQEKAAEDSMVKLSYESQKTSAGKLSWLKGAWEGRFPAFATYSHCSYDGIGSFHLILTENRDHPDVLTGEFTFVGAAYKLRYGDKSDCESKNGSERTFFGEASYDITKVDITKVNDAEKAVELDIEGLRRKCSGVVSFEAGWDHSFCTKNFETFSLSFDRVDDAHIQLQNRWPDLNVVEKQSPVKQPSEGEQALDDEIGGDEHVIMSMSAPDTNAMKVDCGVAKRSWQGALAKSDDPELIARVKAKLNGGVTCRNGHCLSNGGSENLNYTRSGELERAPMCPLDPSLPVTKDSRKPLPTIDELKGKDLLFGQEKQ